MREKDINQIFVITATFAVKSLLPTVLCDSGSDVLYFE